MSKTTDAAVTRADDGSWTYQCPGIPGDPCGGDLPANDFTPNPTTFVSTGWPTKKVAEARGKQHADEHEGGEPMPELSAFRDEHGLEPHEDGLRAVAKEND